jgi:hypothetical protein
MADTSEIWEIWFPQAGATGLPFARGRMAPAEIILVHAAPPQMDVTVRDGAGRVLAQAHGLAQTADTPIARLTRQGAQIARTDIWPTAGELGLPVLLCGGEVGILNAWWHAADHSEWRWQIELYNHR